jgi:hypothetical protein
LILKAQVLEHQSATLTVTYSYGVTLAYMHQTGNSPEGRRRGQHSYSEPVQIKSEHCLTIFITLLLAASLVTGAFADEITNQGGTTSADVKATYKPAGEAAIVYSVEVIWGSMECKVKLKIIAYRPQTYTSMRTI